MSRGHLHRRLIAMCLDRPLELLPDLGSLRSFVLLSSGRLYFSMQKRNQLVAGPTFVGAAPGALCGLKNDTSSRGWLVAADSELISSLLAPFLEATGATALLPQIGVEMVPLSRETAVQIGGHLEQIHLEMETKTPGWRESSILHLGRMLIELNKSMSDLGAAASAAYLDIEDLSAYLTEHYGEEFSLNDLANLCGYLPGNLSRAFKEVAGRPLFSYINDIRIEKSCGLLKRTDMTVLEISFAVGYNNVSFFNRYFRKLMGSSPTEYRKMSKS